MSNSYIPDTPQGHLEWSGQKIKNLLEIHDYTSTKAIIKQLIVKDINLNPRHLSVLFDPKLPLITDGDRFTILKEVMENLRSQGIYIPYMLDSYTLKNGVGYIAKSSHHVLGTLPVTRHNALDLWRWMKYGQSIQSLVERNEKIIVVAKEIHASWNHRLGWQPWAPVTMAEGYQLYAIDAAMDRADQEDRTEMKWDQVMAYAKSMCEGGIPLEFPSV